MTTNVGVFISRLSCGLLRILIDNQNVVIGQNWQHNIAGLSSLGVPGGPFLAHQLTLIQGGRLCSPKNTGTPGVSDLPTALPSTNLSRGKKDFFNSRSQHACKQISTCKQISEFQSTLKMSNFLFCSTHYAFMQSSITPLINFFLESLMFLCALFGLVQLLTIFSTVTTKDP